MTDGMDIEALQALVGDLRQYHFDKEADVMEALAAEVLELWAMKAAVEQTKAEVDARLKERGMVSVDQLVKPFSPFQIHAGLSDLGLFREWLTRKATEYAQIRAKREVNNETDDDMYEWPLGKSAAYADILDTFNAATAQGDRACGDTR